MMSGRLPFFWGRAEGLLQTWEIAVPFPRWLVYNLKERWDREGINSWGENKIWSSSNYLQLTSDSNLLKVLCLFLFLYVVMLISNWFQAYPASTCAATCDTLWLVINTKEPKIVLYSSTSFTVIWLMSLTDST